MVKKDDGLTRTQRYYLRHSDRRARYQKDNRQKINERRRKNYRKNPEIKQKYDSYRNKNRKKVRQWGRNSDKKPQRKIQQRINWDKRYQKIILLKKEKGNKCLQCGYNKDPKILHFHHFGQKLFTISSSKSKSLEELRIEANKCILLCPNCHAELHLIDRPYKGKVI
jgi:hypothetical protein